MLLRVNEAVFKIKYEGHDKNYHDLDAALLSQALMGISEMGRSAYREAYPEETHSLAVNVKALKGGSFEIHLEAIVPAIEHLYGQFVGLFNRSDMQALDTAGGIGALIASAFGLRKWIAGRKHEKERSGDRTTITTQDGDTTTVPTTVYNIAGNATFITAADKVLKPLDDPKYDHMVISRENGEVLDTTFEEDRGYFQVDADELEEVSTLDLEVAVETVQVSAPARVWTFRSGEEKFNAKVLDEEFLEYVRRVGLQANENTRMVVTRREVVKRRSDGTRKTNHYILKVHRVIEKGKVIKSF